MLPKTQRLTKKLFDIVFFNSKRVHHELFTLQYKEADTVRCAVVVPKKVARLAVDRNNLKRRAYAVFQKHTFKRDVHCVVVIKKVPEGTFFETALQEVLKEF